LLFLKLTDQLMEVFRKLLESKTRFALKSNSAVRDAIFVGGLSVQISHEYQS
jgi:hypothetical protein